MKIRKQLKHRERGSKMIEEKDLKVLKRTGSRSYEATLVAGNINQKFKVHADDRRKAVDKLSQWFWIACKQYEDLLGMEIHKVLTLDDPYGEAVFDSKMDCRDKMYKLLPKEVHQRIIDSSRGAIVSNDASSPYPFKWTVDRRKRNRIAKKEKKAKKSSAEVEEDAKPVETIKKQGALKKTPENPWANSVLVGKSEAVPKVSILECVPVHWGPAPQHEETGRRRPTYIN